MNSLKRIYLSLKTQIDTIADDFENHEALAEAAIKDLESLGSQTSIHLHRIAAMSKQYQQKLDDLEIEAKRWSERAIKVRDEDEQKALQCVKRLCQVQQEITQYQRQLQTSQQQQSSVQDDLEQIQQQLRQLTAQKEMLSARQNRTQINTVRKNIEAQPGNTAHDVFKRWEETVTGAEFNTPSHSDIDHLTTEFTEQEETLELKMMLDELSASQSKQKPQNNSGE